jgi:hypothetical protein
MENSSETLLIFGNKICFGMSSLIFKFLLLCFGKGRQTSWQGFIDLLELKKRSKGKKKVFI